MKLNTAERKSQASWQSWHKHINTFYQRLANKRLRRKARVETKGLLDVDYRGEAYKKG